jgi:uncharacterized protein YbaR (Trm112 family)/SAM-dependent methyltransferase
MHTSLLDVLRCPFCGSELSIVEHAATVLEEGRLQQGVLGCQCCAFPVVGGIPVLIADDAARSALAALDAGRADDALLGMLAPSVDEARGRRIRELVLSRTATYREALHALCEDAEGTYFLYRFTDPTYVPVEMLIRALAQRAWPFEGRTLDLCGGSGHLTRVLASLQPAGTVLADVHFWKLWLASRSTAPDAEHICCDANGPLPFTRRSFSSVVLADAFPYIWHKRLLAEEMMRLVGEAGVVVMPHVHSSLGDNLSAGDTLTPAAYGALFGPLQPRLFSDRRLFDDAIERREVDLTRDVSPEELGGEPSFTLIASARPDLYRRYELSEPAEIRGELAVNPLYRVDVDGAVSTLTLEFPTPEYEEEFGACRRYLPDRVTVSADLSGPIERERLGSAYAELLDRRVLIDAPVGYAS